MKTSKLFDTTGVVAAIAAATLFAPIAHSAEAGGATQATRTPGSVSVTLSPAIGLSVDVTVEFESVTNLSLLNAGLSGTVIDPLDLALLGRLPTGVADIPAAFPVMVLVEPPGGLTPLEFDGLASVTLRTENLPYYNGIRLRLFTAHDGGNFTDITNEVTQGSYRVRGSNGEFSEFLIVQDDRANGDVVTLKLAALQAGLVSYVALVEASLYSALTAHLAAVEVHWLNDDRADAIDDLDAFTAAVAAASPADMPNTWSAAGGVANVNGNLRSMASSLRFSLADNPCPASGNYMDTDADGIPDECDNCTLVMNASQCDTNSDGFGNHCDADLNDNGVVNFLDLGMLKSAWLTADPIADLNCNGVVNFIDLATMKSFWLAAPGPSGIAP